jgi:hypothetical protein
MTMQAESGPVYVVASTGIPPHDIYHVFRWFAMTR